jgi:hypothetical protein
MIRRTVLAVAFLAGLAPRVHAQAGLFKEDTAHASGHYGMFGLAVRKDASGTLCDTDGDYCPFQVDANGQVRVVAAQAGAPWSVSGSGTFTVAGTIAQGNAGSHAQRWMIGLSDGAGFISPATDRTTAAGPFSFELSDGAAFYTGAKTGQFPAALVGGRLDANLGAWLGSTAPTVGQKAMASSVPVTLASDQPAVPISAASLPLPTGAAQDGTLTGGTQKAIARGGAKGATTAADVTSTAEGADHQAVDVQLYSGGVAKDPTAVRALTSADAVTAVQGTAAATAGAWPAKLTDGTNVTAVKAGSTAAAAADPAAVVSLSPNSALPAGANAIGTVTVTPPTLTKGSQGATGFSVQNLYDAGRTAISFYANNVASGTTTTETLITLTQSSGTGATSSASTYTITNGKRLRLTEIQVASRGNATATIQSTVFNLRLNTAGACVVTSTPILMGIQSATAAVASAWDRVTLPIPDGYEIAGNGTIALCISAAATFTTNAPTWSVNLIGYEY